MKGNASGFSNVLVSSLVCEKTREMGQAKIAQKWCNSGEPRVSSGGAMNLKSVSMGAARLVEDVVIGVAADPWLIQA